MTGSSFLLTVLSLGVLFNGLVVINSVYLDVMMQQFVQISDGSVMDYQLKLKKVGKERVIYGNVTVHDDVGEGYFAEGLMFKKQGGEYRLLPYKAARKPTCELLKDDVYIYPSFANQSDFPFPYPCPLKIGVYEIRNFKPDISKVPLTIIPSGDYALEYRLYKDDKMVSNFRFYGSIVQI